MRDDVFQGYGECDTLNGYGKVDIDALISDAEKNTDQNWFFSLSEREFFRGHYKMLSAVLKEIKCDMETEGDCTLFCDVGENEDGLIEPYLNWNNIFDHITQNCLNETLKLLVQKNPNGSVVSFSITAIKFHD